MSKRKPPKNPNELDIRIPRERTYTVTEKGDNRPVKSCTHDWYNFPGEGKQGIQRFTHWAEIPKDTCTIILVLVKKPTGDDYIINVETKERDVKRRCYACNQTLKVRTEKVATITIDGKKTPYCDYFDRKIAAWFRRGYKGFHFDVEVPSKSG